MDNLLELLHLSLLSSPIGLGPCGPNGLEPLEIIMKLESKFKLLLP